MMRSDQWLGRLQDSVPGFLRPIEFRPAQTISELTAASRLVYREYLKRGYLRPQPSQLKLSLFQALPTTTTFLAIHRRTHLVGTISLIEDSPLGLPMDEAYKSELDRLRRSGHRLGEATMLSLNTDLFGRGVFTMFHAKKLLLTLGLFRVMFEYMRACTPIDELVACFNPKHQVLYDFLQLKPLGPLKAYTSANGNPAVARHLNVDETRRRERSHVAYRFFFGSTPSPRRFGRKLVLSPQELRKLFVVQTPIFASLSPTELAHIRQCYPTYDFQSIISPTISLPG
jgi:hypothetical protein